MKKYYQKFGLILITLFVLVSITPVYADDSDPATPEEQEQFPGILPGTEETAENCKTKLDEFQTNFETKIQEFNTNQNGYRTTILGCAVKTGRIELWMIPYYITYSVQFILTIAGTICVLFILIGGYYYIFGGISDDKEKGKNTIKYAIIGFIVVLMAWILVNFVQVQITS